MAAGRDHADRVHQRVGRLVLNQETARVGPVLDPTGRRLFERLEDWTKLELLKATPPRSGTVWLSYRVPGRTSGRA